MARLTVHIDPGPVLHTADSVGRRALVQPAVRGVEAGDVEMTDDLPARAEMLSYHQPATVMDYSGCLALVCFKTKHVAVRESDIDSSLIRGGSIID